MITGKAKVEFGTGDILIVPLVKEDKSKGCLVLQRNKEPQAIGEFRSTKEFKQQEDDTVIAFTKIESLDVFIERLNTLRSMITGEIECDKTVEYDY